MSDRALYSARDLVFSYGLGQYPALTVSSLDLEEGECVMLTGPNGSGKTTFLKLLNDLLPCDTREGTFSGRLSFRGETVRRDSSCFHPRSVRQCTVYMHQHTYVFAGSVAHNLDFACRARGLSKQEATKSAEKALGLVGLQGYASRKQRGLSGGEAQRLALARVIAVGSEVLLLDEPTASADAMSRGRIVDALAALAAGGATIIFSTHDKELMNRIAGRVLEFERGAIVGDYRR